MLRGIRAIVLFVACGATAASAVAEATFVSQTRFVQVTGGVMQTIRREAQSFASWNDQIGFEGGIAYAAQRSMLGTARIDFIGNVNARPERAGGFWQFHITTSALDTVFTIAEPHSYEAVLTASGEPLWGYIARLTEVPSGAVVFDGAAASGMLPAGTYRLVYEVSTSGRVLPGGAFGIPALGQGSLTAHLALAVGDNQACCFGDGTCQDLPAAECASSGGTPEGVGSSCAAGYCGPCLGDADQDKSVGLNDVAWVIGVWGQMSPPVPATIDLDGDGLIGLGDIAMAITHWGQICP